MKQGKITIGGVEYPCRVTMGAMLRFKRETGRDVSQMNGNDVADLVTFMWCCVKSACMADKVAMDFTLEEMADSLEPGDMESFNATIENVEKKRRSRRCRGRHRGTAGHGDGVHGDEL